MTPIIVIMAHTKSTKNTEVYSGEGSVIPTLYIQKSAFKDVVPEEISVRIEQTEIFTGEKE